MMRPVVWAPFPVRLENLNLVPAGLGIRTSLRWIQTGEISKSIFQSLLSWAWLTTQAVVKMAAIKVLILLIRLLQCVSW